MKYNEISIWLSYLAPRLGITGLEYKPPELQQTSKFEWYIRLNFRDDKAL